MKRREFMLSVGALSLLSPFAASAAEAPKVPETSKYAALARTAADCVRTGEICLAHCRKQLAAGNMSFVKCEEKVNDMLALTHSLLTLASAGSPLVPKLAAVCAEACRTCKDACAEHKEHFAHGMHLACKECMEACEACERACGKVTA